MKLLTEKRPIGVQLTLKEFVKKLQANEFNKSDLEVEVGGYQIKLDLEYDKVEIDYAHEIVVINYNPDGGYDYPEMFVKLKAKNKEK